MAVLSVLPRRLLGIVVLSLVTPAAPAWAQSAMDHVALGDREHAASDPRRALQHYQEAVKSEPRSYEALWKATRDAIDVAEYANVAERDSLYAMAELYARRAAEANPGDAEGHFALARALGKRALSVGKRDRVRYAADVRTHALEALRLDPAHAGALHVMGMWNYNIMSLNGIARYVVKRFLGGTVFESASWSEAQRYMEASVAAEPDRAVHHLDLARVYVARGNSAGARSHYARVALGTATSFNDQRYRSEAARELQSLR